jgi:hypothetical protein
MIQCGSFTTDGSGNATVNLGWEPQYVLIRKSAEVDNWYVYDSSRNWSVSGYSVLNPNLPNAEDTGVSAANVVPNANGFAVGNNFAGATKTYIYLAIRRPNKPPTSGTQVYNAIARTGTGAAATVTGVGFAPDCVLVKSRSNAITTVAFDKLRGVNRRLDTANVNSEVTETGAVKTFEMDGVTTGDASELNQNTLTYINHFFKRAPGVFDVVCYTGVVGDLSVKHNLGVRPEFLIIKPRNYTAAWTCWHSGLGEGTATTKPTIRLSAAAGTLAASADIVSLSATDFIVGDARTSTNNTGVSGTYVAYLFATKAGISFVGSYTGNGGTADSAGTSQTINCGFTAGSRFVMIKCTSHASDWVVVDTTRGLVAANDPTLSLNTTAAEVTGQDLLDPNNSGFVVNQLGSAAGTSANFNVTGRTYIVLSFA